MQAFCPNCGSPIYSTTPGEGVQAIYIVRVGILRQRDKLAPKRQNWFRSARPWVTDLDEVHKNAEAGVNHGRTVNRSRFAAAIRGRRGLCSRS